MDTLQAELRETYPLLDIQIVGINEFDQDPPGFNELMTADRTTPWLQDVDDNGNQISDVWYDSWDVTYRDVIILNGQNEVIEVFNLTPPSGFDLGIADNYAALRGKLLDAAMDEQKPWQNHRDRFDINDDGFVVPGDVLIMINEINANGPLELPPPTGPSLAPPFWDASGDNFFSPVDILQVINFIEAANAEGEASSESGLALTTSSYAMPSTEALALTEMEPAETQIVAVALAGRVEPAGSVQAVPSNASTEERFRPSASNDDAFWADYWPSL